MSTIDALMPVVDAVLDGLAEIDAVAIMLLANGALVTYFSWP